MADRTRVLLLGAGGQLGMQLARQLKDEVALEALTRAQVDFTNADAVRAALRGAFAGVGAKIVINAAAYTAVDKAEQEREAAHLVNAVAPGVIAEIVAGQGGWLVHYSTDYVFDGSGTQPWLETDATGPLGVYGQSKLDGELAIAETGCRRVILRTSWVYAAEGRNFLHTMLRLGREREKLSIVDDQVGAPTSAEEITQATRAVIRRLEAAGSSTEAGGVYHLTCAGETSWCGFAKAIFAEFAERQKAPEVTPIPTEAYPTPAKRPKNSRLNCEKFAGHFGFHMPGWERALKDVAATLLAGKEQ